MYTAICVAIDSAGPQRIHADRRGPGGLIKIGAKA
jgi:hypothetical protein